MYFQKSTQKRKESLVMLSGLGYDSLFTDLEPICSDGIFSRMFKFEQSNKTPIKNIQYMLYTF